MNMWGQMSFCRRNVLTMVFVIDPTTELGQSLLSYMMGLHQNGAPIRIGLILAPGASSSASSSSSSPSTKRASAYLAPNEQQTLKATARLRDLSAVYEEEAWAKDVTAKEAEEKALIVAEGMAVAEEGKASDSSTTSGGGSGGVFSGGGGGEEEEAVRLGWLLTKLFIYLKMRAGTGTAGRFLSGVDQLRQSPTAAFFGGGGLDELAESHLEQAFKSSFTSTLKKKVSPEEIYGKLRDGHKDISDYESATNAGLDFLEEKGLGELPALLVNGVLSPLTMNYEQEIMQALSMEHRAVTGLIHKRKITDDMKDLPYEIAKAGSAFPRYSKELLLPTESIGVASLTRSDNTLTKHVAWVASPAGDQAARAASDAASAVAKAEAAAAKAERRAAKAAEREEMMASGMMGTRTHTRTHSTPLHTAMPFTLFLSDHYSVLGPWRQVCMAMICLPMRW